MCGGGLQPPCAFHVLKQPRKATQVIPAESAKVRSKGQLQFGAEALERAPDVVRQGASIAGRYAAPAAFKH